MHFQIMRNPPACRKGHEANLEFSGIFRNFHSMPRESMARDIANMGFNVAVMNTKSLVAEILSTDPAKRPGLQICKVLSEDQVPRWWFQPTMRTSKIHFPRNRDENEENH